MSTFKIRLSDDDFQNTVEADTMEEAVRQFIVNLFEEYKSDIEEVTILATEGDAPREIEFTIEWLDVEVDVDVNRSDREDMLEDVEEETSE